MEYNKRNFQKVNDRKVLHKVKKQWVVMSMALLGMLGVGAAHAEAHASANVPDPNQRTNQQQKQTSAQNTYTLTGQQGRSVTNHQSRITSQAHQLTANLVQRAALQSRTGLNRTAPRLRSGAVQKYQPQVQYFDFVTGQTVNNKDGQPNFKISTPVAAGTKVTSDNDVTSNLKSGYQLASQASHFPNAINGSNPLSLPVVSSTPSVQYGYWTSNGQDNPSDSAAHWEYDPNQHILTIGSGNDGRRDEMDSFPTALNGVKNQIKEINVSSNDVIAPSDASNLFANFTALSDFNGSHLMVSDLSNNANLFANDHNLSTITTGSQPSDSLSDSTSDGLAADAPNGWQNGETTVQSDDHLAAGSTWQRRNTIYRYEYYFNGNHLNNDNDLNQKMTSPAENDQLSGMPGASSLSNASNYVLYSDQSSQKSNQTFTYHGNQYQGTVITVNVNLAKKANANDYQYYNQQTGEPVGADVFSQSNQIGKPLSDIQTNHLLSSNYKLATNQIDGPTNVSNGIYQHQNAKYYGKLSQYSIPVLPKAQVTNGSVYKFVNQNDGTVISQLTRSGYDANAYKDQLAPNGYHIYTSKSDIQTSQPSSDVNYNSDDDTTLRYGKLTTYTIPVVPEIKQPVYQYNFVANGSQNKGSEITLNPYNSDNPVPELPQGLKSGYYYKANDPVNNQGETPASNDSNPDDPNYFYQYEDKKYYGQRQLSNVTVEPIKSASDDKYTLNTLEFDYVPKSGPNQGRNVIIGTYNAGQGKLNNDMVNRAYQTLTSDNSLYKSYYAKPAASKIPTIDQLLLHPNYEGAVGNYLYGGQLYNGSRKSYLIPVTLASGVNVNGTNGLPNVPVNGDRVVGNLPIPIYDGPDNDSHKIIDYLKLDFGSPLEKDHFTASDSKKNSIYVGDPYTLEINGSSWLQKYITDHYLHGNYKEDSDQTSASNFADGKMKDPRTVQIKFDNVATTVPNDTGTQAQKDNHIDMFMRIDDGQWKDVARVPGRVGYEPKDGSSRADDKRDYIIEGIDWYKNPDASKTQGLYSEVNTDGADPLSLHYAYNVPERGIVYYSNADGDLLDANPSDNNKSITVNGKQAFGTSGHVVTWSDGNAVSGKDANDVLNDSDSSNFAHFAQDFNNGTHGHYQDGTEPVNLPSALANEGFQSNFSVNFSHPTWRNYQGDGQTFQSDGQTHTERVFSVTGMVGKKNPDNANSFNAHDTFNQMNVKQHGSDSSNFDIPISDGNGNFTKSTANQGVNFKVVNRGDNQIQNNPIKNGDSAFLMPFSDQTQMPSHVKPGMHWIVPTNVAHDYIPENDHQTEHGTFDANGDFVPDDYENDGSNHLNWHYSREKIQYVIYDPVTKSEKKVGANTIPKMVSDGNGGLKEEVNSNHQVVYMNPDQLNFYYDPSIKNDDYVGKDIFYSNDNQLPKALLDAGYHLDPNARDAHRYGKDSQYFILGNGEHTADVYISKADTVPDNNPASPDHYIPVGPRNPNFNSSRPVGPGNWPYLPEKTPVPSDQPDSDAHPNINRHENLIPSPNHAHVDPQNPSNHGGMVPDGPAGWIPGSDVPAIKADFNIHANVSMNDGGGYINGSDLPIAIDVDLAHSALNTTYTLSSKNIREAIVNRAYQGYTDRDGEAQDLYYDSIMRKPGEAYQPIQYQIVNRNGAYHVVLVGNGNRNAGDFMFTPSNAIIDYEGTSYKRNAASDMKAINSVGKDQFNRPNSTSDRGKQVESVVAEGYQGMRIDPINNKDVRTFFNASGWSLEPVNGEKISPFILEGYDYNYVDQNSNDDHHFIPTTEHDEGSGLVKRLTKYDGFYNAISGPLSEHSDLNDEQIKPVMIENQTPDQNHITINGKQYYEKNGDVYSNDQQNRFAEQVGANTIEYNNGTLLKQGQTSNAAGQPLMVDDAGNLMIDPDYAGNRAQAGIDAQTPAVSATRQGNSNRLNSARAQLVCVPLRCVPNGQKATALKATRQVQSSDPGQSEHLSAGSSHDYFKVYAHHLVNFAIDQTNQRLQPNSAQDQRVLNQFEQRIKNHLAVDHKYNSKH